MKRLYVIIGLAVLTLLQTQAQGVAFYSPGIERGVKLHLGLAEGDVVTSSQLDTISRIDLSALAISDLRDMVMLPNLKAVNLSDNEIDDVTPLAELDSLQEVDLSKNQLESINALVFSHATRMMVDVAFNYINDFSCFQTLTPCCFTIEGTSLQEDRNAPYFILCYLYGDGTSSTSEACCRILTNTHDVTSLECGDSKVEVSGDGTETTLRIGENEPRPVVLMRNGTSVDSTWIVPLTTRHIQPSETMVIATGLPEDYSLKYVTAASQGTLKVEGTTIVYTASETFKSEDILFSYYKGSDFKGMGRVQLGDGSSGINNLLADNGKLMLVDKGAGVIAVSCNDAGLSSTSTISVFDTTGRLLAEKLVDGSNGIDTEMFILHARHAVLIVRVVSGQKRFIEKLIAK